MRRSAKPLAPLRRAKSPVAVALAGACVVWLPACESYTRRPLDVALTREHFAARDPSGLDARGFAERLARAEGAPLDGFDASDGLTLAEAEPVALVFNRELRVARLEADVSRAGAENAGRWEDPTLGVDVERILSGVADPWVVAGTVGLTIPVSGRLGVERARADAHYLAVLERLGASEWATRSAVREMWVEWSAQVIRAELAEELCQRIGRVASLAEGQEAAGVLSRIDERLLRVELGSAEAEAVLARGRLKELELQLRDLLGLTPDAPVRLVSSIRYEPRYARADDLLSLLEARNAELAALRAEYEVAEQSLRLEVRRQYPDVQIGPGVGIDQGDERVLLGVRLPVPLWNQNRLGVAQATSHREVARGRFESAYEQLVSRVAISRSRFESARAARELLESRVVPLADEQDAEVRRVAELGRVDPLLLLQTIRTQHDLRSRLVDARAAESIEAIRLDELIGPPSTTPSDASRVPAGSATPTEGGSR